MAAGSSAIFALNAGVMLGAGGAILVGMAGAGALAGLLFWYIGEWGQDHDSYTYQHRDPETGHKEERVYDPMDRVVQRK